MARLGLSPPSSIGNAIWIDDGSTFFTLDLQDQALFQRFRYRTLYSLGGSEMADIYENHMLKVSFTCPFLMHGTLAVTAVHDRYLDGTPAHRRSLRESNHWSQCTMGFNEWLSQPIREEQKDPLWATAGTLAILTFSSINACFPHEAWPLGAPDSSDLEWLRLGAGKMTLWNLVNPLRPESVFRIMSTTFTTMRRPLPMKGTDGVSAELAQLCGLDQSSSRDNNPYFMVAHAVSRFLRAPVDETLQRKAMMALSHMHHGFGTFLEKKDPIALLLLCLWYTRARESIWWIGLRARYELPAICTYLQRYHKDKSAIQALIPKEGKTGSDVMKHVALDGRERQSS
ncbi:Fc.00g034430.m01.CDS01 [Cosmosporella sp. VM-42]